jgi:2-amino-4-hydroxy-6-hydroxymethyldihydropteridine diphosphokinase
MESETVTPLDVVIGLGANIGSPEAALCDAALGLSQLGRLTALSDLYRSLPVGGPPQPDFLNAAVRLQYGGSAEELLAAAHELEHRAGRERRVRWGPRTLDLDILWIAGVSIARDGFHVPHARLRERAFALRPLLDVAPDARDPADGVAYREVLQQLGPDQLVRVRSNWVGALAGQASRGMDRPGS